ncbi:hypothetical protein CWO85_00470 [Candidatus Phytoplasma ziziphi]|uniref:Uncharacterized protein n=1 Tax=Ziziphus jujuba witches'-broom phytoplasma TaxID=135727 RepID=A0A660HMK6_ZIZJU|nr:hypothetical protein [Candidatus Phytoplasma ziziphi]AYJ01016.1 hypothetical protein CWO85_00470 [Candidatus Phytoplasma ziziphi]
MKIKNIFLFLIIPSIILILIIFFIFAIQKEKQNKKETIIYEQKNFFKTPKKLLSKFDNNYSKALAYLGLNRFIIGLQNNIYEYKTLWIGDKEIFIEKILNGNLGTASSPLIFGTINFLGEKLNKKINLFINDYLAYNSINKSNSETQTFILELKNDKNHFFINDFEDTLGDGYCFFNAIVFLLDQEINNWKNIIFSDIPYTQILTDKEILQISVNL